MIDLKEAIERAKEFIVEMNGQPENLQIEEVTLSSDGRSWSVTLSYFKRIQTPNELQTALGLEGTRTYKRVVIDSEDKKIIGMFNWAFDKSEAA